MMSGKDWLRDFGGIIRMENTKFIGYHGRRYAYPSFRGGKFSKKEFHGGMGFCDLKAFNKALFAK